VSSDTQTIRNRLLPEVDAGEDVVAFMGYATQLNATATGASEFFWLPPQAVNQPNILDPIASFDQSTYLTLTVVSDEGCIARDSLFFEVQSLADIPTGITPNGDGINDVWNIPALENYPNVRVYVYDQAGRRVFESDGYPEPWDGTFDGNLLPRASYYWIIDLQDGINEPFKGIISVIK
jgi:gliding motility-associated-like protein